MLDEGLVVSASLVYWYWAQSAPHDESALTLWQSHVCVLLVPPDDISERLDLGVFVEIGNKALNLTRELVISRLLVGAGHSGPQTLSHATVVRVSPLWLSTS